MSSAPQHSFVHVTDIHHKGDADYLEKVVRAINAQQPDFVCFTGDLVTFHERAVLLPAGDYSVRDLRAQE